MAKSYWSLICFPLALACAAISLFMMVKGSLWPAVGVSILGLYMLILQTIWAHLTVGKALSRGDVVLMLSCLAGAGFALAMVFGSCHEPTINYLVIGALLSPIVGRPLAVACDNCLGRSKGDGPNIEDKGQTVK